MPLLYDYYFCYTLHLISPKEGIKEKGEWKEKQSKDMEDLGWNNIVLSYRRFKEFHGNIRYSSVFSHTECRH